MSAAVEQATVASPGKRRSRVFLMYILPLLIAIGVVAMPLVSTVSVLPKIRVSPGFALIDQRGQTLTNQDLHGEIVLYGLASLDCDESCRTTIDAMREARQRIVSDSGSGESDLPDIHLVTVVVDPVEDPAALQAFASRWNLDPDRWSVASGSEPALRALLASGFEVHPAKADDGNTVRDPALFLTDHAGILRAEYRTETPRAGTIAGDIERILDEARAGSVGGLLYNAAHSLSLSCGG